MSTRFWRGSVHVIAIVALSLNILATGVPGLIEAYRVEQPGDLAATLKAAIADVKGGRTAVVDVVTARMNGSLHHLWDPNVKQGAAGLG